jgi:methionyl-tRNA formyltransferase
VVEISNVKLDKEIVEKALIDHNIELGVVADFSFIVPETIINTPKFGLINIHFSLLPKLRGASPVQFSILNGDTVTGVTYYLMTKSMDDGDILDQFEYKLTNSESTESLYSTLFKMAADKLPKVINDYVDGVVKPRKQDQSKATYTYSKTNPKSTLISKDDAKINWQDSPTLIDRTIRAFYPWPIAWTTLDELSKSFLVKDYKLAPNKDISLRVKVYSSSIENDKLKITKIQVEGSKIIKWNDFLNGYFVKKA